MNNTLDCLVMGAEPAGLNAAIYLARFNFAIRILDNGASRCATISRTRNHADYPGGIPGKELLTRMRGQAAELRAHVTEGRAGQARGQAPVSGR